MAEPGRTVIVTGASQGIGAEIARLLLERGYNVVANSRRISYTNELRATENLALVDGDIGHEVTAQRLVATAIDRFGSVDALVNNAGIFLSKPFTEYTSEEIDALMATNVYGFIHTTQAVVRQILAQGSGGSIVSISATIAEHPLAGFAASIPMITKGGVNAISRSLAMEYAQSGIRVNVVAPGVVDTPLLNGVPQDYLLSLSPIGQIPVASDIATAVLYLTEARQVTGEVLHVDGGMHMGRW
jgi:NAD(P)-dependent dehydrogenase (short-subunit alcohol dehydrogenase family)